MPPTTRELRTWLNERGASRVPQITAMFWIIKALSTAMGESTSDYLVHAMAPEVAVVIGFIGFAGALLLQFRKGRYIAWTYWLAVVMVGIFGTMAADVVHVGLDVPYTASTFLYALLLAAVFVAWQRSEHTLSIHAIDTPRRELFYWSTVVATFAMGTALGDFTAYSLHLGYFPSALLFAGLILVPALSGYRVLRWNAVFSFWFAYVLTRPLGASVADGLGKPKDVSGVGIGAGWVVIALTFAIAALVAEEARRDAADSSYRRQNSRCVTPLGLGTESRWKRSSSSFADSQSRSPRPSSIGATAMCIVSTRSASRNSRTVATPPPRRTSLPSAASFACRNASAGVRVDEVERGVGECERRPHVVREHEHRRVERRRVAPPSLSSRGSPTVRAGDRTCCGP